MSSESGSAESIDDILSILENCSEIVRLQEEIKSHLNTGMFCMTMARNSGCSVSTFSCRFDLSPSAHVDISEINEFELYEQKPEKDPLLLITALPPPQMKKAQNCFKEALKRAIDAANVISKINRAISDVNCGLCDEMKQMTVTEIEEDGHERTQAKPSALSNEIELLKKVTGIEEDGHHERK
jgi:hypothetical protein